MLVVFDQKAGTIQVTEDDRPVGLPAEFQPGALRQGLRIQRAGIVDESGVLIGPDRLAENLPSRMFGDTREDIQRTLRNGFVSACGIAPHTLQGGFGDVLFQRSFDGQSQRDEIGMGARLDARGSHDGLPQRGDLRDVSSDVHHSNLRLFFVWTNGLWDSVSCSPPFHPQKTKKDKLQGARTQFNGIRIEPGMSVEVVTTSFANPLLVNGGQPVVDAFLRIYGIDIRRAGVCTPVYLDVRQIG